jgi:hypothetical protein
MNWVWFLSAGAGLLTALAIVVALVVRRRRRRYALPPFGRGWNGGEPGGVREPRRPLVPAGAASVALPEPRTESRISPPPPRRSIGGFRTPRRRLAS